MLPAPTSPSALEALLQHHPNGLWRASALARGEAGEVVPSGWAALDALLPGGGWPTRAVVDVLLAQTGVLEWRLLGHALAANGALAQRPVLLINPPHPPGAQGLAALGVAPWRLVHVSGVSALHALWATEQALQCTGLGAVLAWLPQARPEQMRRLQCHAQHFDGLCAVMRPESAQAQACAAPLRVLVELMNDALMNDALTDTNSQATQATAVASLRLRVLKRRGPPVPNALHLSAWPAVLAPLQAQLEAKLHARSGARLGAQTGARVGTPSNTPAQAAQPVHSPAISPVRRSRRTKTALGLAAAGLGQAALV